MKLRLMAAAALALAASPALAQGGTISQGMTAEQVRGVFGAPVAVRTSGEWTYWYYLNGCPVRCGSDDVVFFREDRVVAAVLRTPRRRFAGPRANDALERYDDVSAAAGAVAPAAEPPVQMQVRRRGEQAEPARVGGVRVEPGDEDEPVRGEEDARIRTGDSGGARPPARAGSAAAGEGRSTVIRAGEPQPAAGGRPEPTDSRRFGAVRDSALGPPATAVDDERRAREGRVEPNTVRTSPDTMSADQRARERRVQPRVVPRGNP
jgi:hypothetical protein